MTAHPLFPVRARPARRARQLAIAVPLLLGAMQAQALCVGVCSCTAQTTSLLFANYNPLAYGNTDTTGTVSIKCGGVAGLLIPFTIQLSTGGATTFAGRRLANGGNLLSYNLYTDGTYTTILGDGTASTSYISGGVLLDVLSLLGTVTYTVYGRIPGRQVTTVPGGPYVDAVTVTITYQ